MHLLLAGVQHPGHSTGGRWSSVEQQQHINVLELRAALFGLKAFCSEMQNIHVKLELDNTSAIAYINHMGGSKSEELNQLAYELWDWCRMHNIWVTAAHIPGVHKLSQTGALGAFRMNMNGSSTNQHFSSYSTSTQISMLTCLQVD